MVSALVNPKASFDMDESYACQSQVFASNRIVSEKKQRNYKLPGELVEPFEALYPRLKTRGWIVQAAAMLVFLDLPQSDRDRIVGEVLSANSIGGFSELAARAGRGQLLEEANPN